MIANIRPDPKRPRLNTWGNGGSHSPHSLDPHARPQTHQHHNHQSHYHTCSPAGFSENWAITPPHQRGQHTVVPQSRSHSAPGGAVAAAATAANQANFSAVESATGPLTSPHPGGGSSHYTSSPLASGGRPLHISPHAAQGAPTTAATQTSGGAGQNLNQTNIFHAFHPQAQPQSNPNPYLKQGVAGEGATTSTTYTTTPTPASALTQQQQQLSEQRQIQQLRPSLLSGNLSPTSGIPAHFHHSQMGGQDSGYYGTQPPHLQNGTSIATPPGESRGGVDMVSPASSTTLAPGPSPNFTGSLLNHRVTSTKSAGGTSPIVSGGGAGSNQVITTYPPRRKAIRAAQACDACRARKAKCDEGRPNCGFCKETQIACVYREVPPPKQDRTLLQILDRLGKVEALLDSIHSVRGLDKTSGPSPGATAVNNGPTRQPQNSAPMERPPVPNRRQTSPAYVAAMSSAGSNASIANHQPQTSNPVEVPLEEDEQLTIPYQHTTAAHKLLWWPSIRSLVDEDVLVDSETYVMDREGQRGTLRVYGTGEGLYSDDEMDEKEESWGTLGNGGEWDSGIGIGEEFNMDGPWKINGDVRMDGCGNGPGKLDLTEGSGLTTGGGLKLDHQTALKLLNSYLSNIHILHPILDKSTITKMTFMFADRLSTTPQEHSPATRYSTSSTGTGMGVNGGGPEDTMSSSSSPAGHHRRNSISTGKRKRSISISDGQLPQPGLSGAPSSSGARPNTQRIPTKISSALVLLVLALGAVCLHRRPVPGPLPRPQSSSFRTATPPFRTTTPPFPNTPPYHPQYPQRPVSGTRGRNRELRNIDVIPGLAYFSKAMEILGHLVGGNELGNVQAGLLAGLYWGQLGRVLDSWKWISWACMGCQVLVRMHLKFEKDELRKDLILRAFWSCLQLESDVLAELDLPPSGISRLEDSMLLPSSVSLPSPDGEAQEDDPLMWMYYLAQIALRKLLNRVHTALYKQNSPRSLAIARELDFQLEQWKLHLPEPLRWEETDPPSPDINAARLRAKYFGARYIIHRPFVYHAIHRNTGTVGFSTSSPALSTSEMSQQGSPASAPAATPGGGNGFGNRRISTTGDDRMELAPASLESLEMSCRKCLESAVQSTTAFHAFYPGDHRPIITNVFGTAHAQFGNLLVLQAAYHSPTLKNMVIPHVLGDLITKTTYFLKTLVPISSALKRDVAILENVASKLDFPLHNY